MSLNVATEIKLDHDNVRDLFERFQATSNTEEKASITNTLIREMAIHSDAEEISVYPQLGKYGLGDTAEHNKEEHAEVKALVLEAERSAKGDAGDQVLSRAVTAFLSHASEEETDQLPLLVQKLTPAENDALARSFLAARSKVPTRPHPAAPQSGGLAQKAAGMPASLVDKLVESVQGRQFVDLKYQHPTV